MVYKLTFFLVDAVKYEGPYLVSPEEGTHMSTFISQEHQIYSEKGGRILLNLSLLAAKAKERRVS